MKRLAGLVSASARPDEDSMGDGGSNVSVNPGTFVILSVAGEKDRAGGWEAPAPRPRDDDKIGFVPSTGVFV